MLSANRDTFQGILAGELDPTAAFMSGRLRVEGDMGLAMILSLLAIYFLVVGEFKSFRVGGIVMMTFLFSFFGIFPGFSLLNLTSGIYFTATAMIGAIAL